MPHYAHSVSLYRHETKLSRKREARRAAYAWVAIWVLTLTSYVALVLLGGACSTPVRMKPELCAQVCK